MTLSGALNDYTTVIVDDTSPQAGSAGTDNQVRDHTHTQPQRDSNGDQYRQDNYQRYDKEHNAQRCKKQPKPLEKPAGYTVVK